MNTIQRAVLAASLGLFSSAAMAQSANFQASELIETFCSFLKSPLISLFFAIILVVLVLAYLNDMVRDGLASTILKFVIGIFVILNIGTVLSWFGASPIC